MVDPLSFSLSWVATLLSIEFEFFIEWCCLRFSSHISCARVCFSLSFTKIADTISIAFRIQIRPSFWIPFHLKYKYTITKFYREVTFAILDKNSVICSSFEMRARCVEHESFTRRQGDYVVLNNVIILSLLHL